MKALKISLICGLSLGFLSGIFSLIFNFGDWVHLGVVFFMAMFIGLIAAPEIEPKAFKNPGLFQASCGIVSGIFCGIMLKGNTEIIVLLALIGGILGWSAPFWVKHAPLP